ncbi:MAG TPA: hypothetical protein VHC47_02270 [Mucilaginibacter sp.]|nr:hypothetical protein [Mucilaginibacter sp.]
MKKYVKILFLAGALSVFGVTASQAQQVVIRVRPAEPARIAPPPRPSGRHVWVEGEWVVKGGAYVYTPGYWALPPRPRAIWVRGHWRHTRRGWVWIPGHWR